MTKQKIKTGDEVDMIHCRRWYHWQRGSLKKIKRGLMKRLRQMGKKQIEEELEEG